MFCAGQVAAPDTCADAIRDAYLNALGLLVDLGYRSVFRLWNFIGRINEANSQGLEVYRDFCLGRAAAFDSHALRTADVPAATGIGSLGDGIAFCLLACRRGRVTGVENPRQIPAYHYPSRYGPSSPRFARATHVRSPGAPESEGRIYVSGTASILGHESKHAGDVKAQCRVAIENIASVISPHNLAVNGLRGDCGLNRVRTAKVYVRRRVHMPLVRHICEEALPPAADVVYLNVDICRSELLVEIEAIADCLPPTAGGSGPSPASHRQAS
ncbi:hypothetical protein GCM10009753_68580 [Streptantibioticus ferralitis]